MSTAQVTARLAGDASDFKSMLTNAEAATGAAAKGIGQKFELKQLGATMATALGLNLESMAKAAARAATGITEELENAFKRLEDVSTKAADSNIAAMRALASEETKYQLLLQDRERLTKRMTEEPAPSGNTWKDKINSFTKYVGLAPIFTADGEAAQAKRKADKDAANIALNETNAKLAAADQAREKAAGQEAEARAKWVNGLKEGVIVTKELGDADAKRLETTEATTAELEKQVEKLEEAKKQTIEIKRIGREDADLTDRELERKVKNLRKGIAATSASTLSDPNIGRYLNQPAELELARLQGEINLRRDVRGTAGRVGEDRAFQMFNLSEARFAEILRGQTEQTEQTKLLRQLNQNIEHGITVRALPLATIPGATAGAV